MSLQIARNVEEAAVIMSRSVRHIHRLLESGRMLGERGVSERGRKVWTEIQIPSVGSLDRRTKEVPQLEPLECARLAGFTDADGSIQINKVGRYWTLKLILTNNDLGQLIRFRRLCGYTGTIQKVRGKQAHRWTIVSREAAAIIKQLLPFLHTKKEQAKGVLEFQDAKRFTGSPGLTPDEKAAQRATYLATRERKRVFPAVGPDPLDDLYPEGVEVIRIKRAVLAS